MNNNEFFPLKSFLIGLSDLSRDHVSLSEFSYAPFRDSSVGMKQNPENLVSYPYNQTNQLLSYVVRVQQAIIL